MGRRFQIAVCDDNPAHQQTIGEITAAFFRGMNCFAAIDYCKDGAALLDSLQRNHADILLMDVYLAGGESGISLAQRVNHLLPDTQIIFLTGHPDVSTEVYQARHVYLMHKDKISTELASALSIAIRNLDKPDSDALCIRYRNQISLLPKNEIEYLEKDLRMIHFHMRHGIIYHAYGKFDDYAPEIADYHFVRCHRSYVVNLDYLKCIRGSDLLLLDGTAIPIGRSYKPQVLDMLTNSK
jgi:DNA-binding LytR/AlgR family response regulator